MKIILAIQGTHCNACKILIEDVARDIPGVRACSVDPQTGRTEIEHDDGLNFELFKKEIESLGNYKVEINPY